MPRSLAAALATGALALAQVLGATGFPGVVPGRPLAFPRDFGAHPDYRIEWWYVTGQVADASGPLGFQVTFFRVRNPPADSNPSAFSPRQLVFAHAALTDPGAHRYLHDQRAARAYDGLVHAAQADTDVRLDDWSLAREGGIYHALVQGDGFALSLALAPTQPVLLEGDAGFSRKGPRPTEASYYYSEPQLRVEGTVRIGGQSREVRGTAWLDHEWSSQPLAPEAAGWDWLGANLDDGGALMAFRMRAKDGTVLWSHATLRAPGGAAQGFDGAEVAFRPLRTWKSPRTGVSYPVSVAVRVGSREWTLEPLMDDQELDARASTGTLYWEGAVRLAGPHGAAAGRGYLELTGYAGRVPF